MTVTATYHARFYWREMSVGVRQQWVDEHRGHLRCRIHQGEAAKGVFFIAEIPIAGGVSI
jgi:hypothetical protein